MPPSKKARHVGTSRVGPGSADDGLRQIQLASETMQACCVERQLQKLTNVKALVSISERYAAERPFEGLRVGINLHVTKETAVLGQD